MPSEGGVSQLLALTVAVPMVSACVVIAGHRLPRLFADVLALGAALAVAGMDGCLLSAASGTRVVLWYGGWRPVHGFSVGISFVADPLSAGLALLVAVLMAAALLYGLRYFESAESHYQALMLLFLAGMQGFALSGDVFDMFVFFELMGAVAYALTAFKVEDSAAVQGGLNFAIMNSLGAYFALFGVGLLYARTGQLGLPELHRAVAGSRPDALVVAAFVLVAGGFLVKAAMTPFHFWLADAHAVAPTSVCVLFSGVMVELGVYGVARLYWVVFDPAIPGHDFRRAFVVLGAITAVVGAVMCFSQRHMKRLLAYSTIAHVGLFLTGIATLDPNGTAGVATYVIGHAGIKSALFLLAGLALNRYGSVDEHDLHGRGRAHRWTGAAFVLGGLALSGLPPFGTALGKGVTEDALSAAGYPWAPALFVVVSIVTGGAVVRARLRVWFGVGPRPEREHVEGTTEGTEERDVPQTIEKVPLSMSLPIAALFAVGLVVGVVPAAADAVGRAAAQFVDAGAYASQALALAGAPAAPPAGDVSWTATGVVLALVSTVGAVGLALAAIYQARLPAPLTWLGGRVRPALMAVRRLHSGHIGDYAAWFVAGLAGLAAIVGLPLR